MKARLVILGLIGCAAAFGQANFVWDIDTNPGLYDSRFSYNGDVTLESSGGGATIYKSTVSGANSNDYEMRTQLGTSSGGGTYMHFLRASTTAQPGVGSYISVEYVVPSMWTSGGSVTININECSSGTVTALGSTSAPLRTGDLMRSVVWGTTLWVFVNNVQYGTYTIPSTTGQPGWGGHNAPAPGYGFQGMWIGHHDTVSPLTVQLTTVATSLLPNSASIRWAGVADDSVGIGVFEYLIARNGTAMATTFEPIFTDATAAASTSYTYTIQAVDFHGNIGTGTNISVTTPASGAVDPRRIGLQPTGSYWGGGGEQIDTLTGNLNFSLPLINPQLRSGVSVPVGAAYNSQNWRNDNGSYWQLGYNNGYGFGWNVQFGSITPYYTSYWTGVDHYVYTDSTGAQYRLDVNTSNVWSSVHANYVWFDANANILHFPNGMFWQMGDTSGGTEPDAGTMYPTIIEDTSGNEIAVYYNVGAGEAWGPSSGRIAGIGDSRATSGAYYPSIYGLTYALTTYGFYYSSGTTPQLTSISSSIPSEGGTFGYSTAALAPPFGSDALYSGVTIPQLVCFVPPTGAAYTFLYDGTTASGSCNSSGVLSGYSDTNGAGELTQVIFPWGGHLRWTYFNDAFSGSRYQRAIGGRYLAADSAGATEWSYGITWDNASSAVTHGSMTLADASGVGAKTWNFTNSGSSAWQIGLVSSFVETASAGGTTLRSTAYTWSQSASSNPYISVKTTTLNPGGSNPQSAQSTQTLDQYGNVTASAIYPYNSTTTPVKAYANTYSTLSIHTSNYIFNLLSTLSLSVNGGSYTTLVTNVYDTGCVSTYCTAPSSTPSEVDSNPIPLGQRGYLITSTTPAGTTTNSWWTYGAISSTTSSSGITTTSTSASTVNYAAPTQITVQPSSSYPLSASATYNSWIGLLSVTGTNGDVNSLTYDSYGRPATSTSPYGAVTTYSYSTTLPMTQTATGPGGVSVTTLDGLGRAILVSTGDTSSVHSYTATVYYPCACSPLAKIQSTSQPYAPGTPSGSIAWTTWTYDGLGRPLTSVAPDGASTTTYAYSGNQTTVTDPAGNWKQFTTDVQNNLTQVVEPDPANMPSGTLTSTYTYDWMNHLGCVDMDRGGTLTSASTYTSSNGATCTTVFSGGTRQTRAFAYDSIGRLTSAVNPENGTVSYTYNSNSTLATKTDAKSQVTVYTYDSNNRVTMVQQYPSGTSNPEDACERVAYTYGTSSSSYNAGRLLTVTYGPGSLWTGSGFSTGTCGLSSYPLDKYVETYTYQAAGGVTSKNIQLERWTGSSSHTSNWEVDYTYNSAGQVATTTYPMAGSFCPVGSCGMASNPVTLTYGFDSMGRPNSLTDSAGISGYPWNYTGSTSNGPINWAQNVSYDYAGRMSSLQYLWGSSCCTAAAYKQQTMNYNTNGQLTSLAWASNPYGSGFGTPSGFTYSYSATQNNGQITQMADALSAETVSYTYDQLKRLTQASSTASWLQTYTYDGFGNLTAKGGSGAQTLTVSAATNRLATGLASYDSNGNMTSGFGATLTYDESNRVATTAETSGGLEYYVYSADNKRIYRMSAGGTEYWTFYGAFGEKLGVYTYASGSGFVPYTSNIYFAGKMILESGNVAYMDRAGTNKGVPSGYGGISGYTHYYPYGEEISGATTNDHEKFATYTRDSYTGLDYADQRYYTSTYGRFNSPDRYIASGGAASPASWNRYTYTRGDPINRVDPAGLEDCDPGDTLPCTVTVTSDPPDPLCCGGGGGPSGPPVTQNSGSCGWATTPQALAGCIQGLANQQANQQAAAAETALLEYAEALTCKGLPDGVVVASSVSAVAGIGGGLSGEIVFNMNTGQVSVFGSYSFTGGGPPSASASIQGGFIWGLGKSNASYSGPFTSTSVGAGVIGATLATTSQGWTNPFNTSMPTSLTVGVQTPGAGFTYGIAQYTNPLNIGSLNSAIFDGAFAALSPGMFSAIEGYYAAYQHLCDSHTGRPR